MHNILSFLGWNVSVPMRFIPACLFHTDERGVRYLCFISFNCVGRWRETESVINCYLWQPVFVSEVRPDCRPLRLLLGKTGVSLLPEEKREHTHTHTHTDRDTHTHTHTQRHRHTDTHTHTHTHMMWGSTGLFKGLLIIYPPMQVCHINLKLISISILSSVRFLV